jgi:hypothetical protein
MPKIQMSWDNVYSWSQFLAVFFAGIALVSGFIVNKRQARVILELSKDVNESKTELAKAQTTASEAKESAEKERQTRLELEKAIAPRVLTNSSKLEALKSFPGTQLIIRFLPDWEGYRAAQNLAFQVGTLAKWKLIELRPDPSLINSFDGVIIKSYMVPIRGPQSPTPEQDLSAKQSKEAAEALIDFLTSEPNNWQVRRMPTGTSDLKDIPMNAVKVEIGVKPNSYFLPQPVKDVLEEAKRMEEELKKRQERSEH